MSVRVMADVWENGPDDPTLNAVLLCLANSADDAGGNCFPGTELIAQRTRYSQRTVIRAIAALAGDGWITIVQRGCGRPKKDAKKHELAEWRTQYEINVAKLKGCQSVTVSESRERVTLAREKGDTVPKKGDTDDNPPHPLLGGSIIDPSEEPSPIVPQGGTGGQPNVCDASSLTEEQEAHLASIADDARRQQWAAHYRGENAQVAEQAAEEARRQMARAVEIGELKRAMPDVAGAVEWVMRKCSFVVVRKGRGLEAVIELAIRQDGREPWLAGEQMGKAWERFKAAMSGGQMRYALGPMTFIRDGMWNDERAWPWNHEQIRRDGEARAGVR